MHNHEALPGDPLDWQEVYSYANELISEGILKKEQIIYHFSLFDKNQPEEAFDWLVAEASNKHLERLDEEFDISINPFNEKKSSKNKLGPFYSDEEQYNLTSQKKRNGSIILRLAGLSLLSISGIRILNNFSLGEPIFGKKLTDGLSQAAVIIVGSLLVSKSMEMEKD